MSDSDVYLPSYPGGGEEMEVASTVQPYEGEPCTSCSLKFSLMSLCFVFRGEIYFKSG